MSRTWVRGGILTLATLQGFVSLWQYVLPASFYDDFPTVSLDPPYNEHLVTDIGGLGLALSAMLFYAAKTMDDRVMTSALLGYLIYAATHFAFHVTHFGHFSLFDAVGVGTGLGLEVVLAAGLLYAVRRSRRTPRQEASRVS